MIEDWLLKDEKYEAEISSDRFIDKSIFSFSKLINSIRKENTGSSYIYKINTNLKLFSLIINLLLISLTRSHLFLVVFNILLLIMSFSINKSERIKIFLISLLFPMFTLVILIPSMLNGNIQNSLLLFYKVFLNIFCLNTLITYSSSWRDLTRSLKLLLIPDIFIWIFELTLKYILLLGEYSIEALQALKLRAIGKSNKVKRNIFQIMGNIFLTSIKMSEEMINAMECRGFTGEYHSKLDFKLNFLDYYYILLNIFILIFFFYTKRL